MIAALGLFAALGIGLIIALSCFCLGVCFERRRVDLLASTRQDRIEAAIARLPHRVYTDLRSEASYVLEGCTYRVPDVDALIAMDCSRAPTDRGSR